MVHHPQDVFLLPEIKKNVTHISKRKISKNWSVKLGNQSEKSRHPKNTRVYVVFLALQEISNTLKFRGFKLSICTTNGSR